MARLSRAAAERQPTSRWRPRSILRSRLRRRSPEAVRTKQRAVAKFPAAFAELLRQHGLAAGPVALVGASIGALVALSVAAAREPPVSAIALVSPALRLTSVVAANERLFAVTHPWGDASRAVAAKLDFVGRATELAPHRTPTLLVIGADDDHEGIARPAEDLGAALATDDIEATIIRIPDMRHAIADEPGLEPAPQKPVATAVDAVVAAWLTITWRSRLR